MAESPDIAHGTCDVPAAVPASTSRGTVPPMHTISLTALAFFSVFSFFPNPLFPENEIFPYFLAPALFLLARARPRALLLLAAGAFVVSLGSQFSSLDVMVTDLLQVGAVACALACVSILSASQRLYLARRLEQVVLGVVVLMIVQYLVPSVLDLTFAYLVRRDSSAADLQGYTGGVAGVAPEPAYMGAYLLGAWILVRRLTGRESARHTVVCTVGVLLTASLSAVLVATVILAVQFVTTLRRTLYCLSIIAVAVAAAVLLESSLAERVTRFLDVAGSELALGLDVLSEIDTAFGSFRLASLVAPLSEVGCGALFCGPESFVKGYSIFAVLYALVAPFHLVFAAALLARARDRLAVASALLALFYGPVLNWAMYAGLVRPTAAHGDSAKSSLMARVPPRAEDSSRAP